MSFTPHSRRHRRSLTKEAVTLIETALATGPRAAPVLPPPIKLVMRLASGFMTRVAYRV